MRDTNRLKEKYEVSLDNRQIVTLTVASLIVLGGVFVLGVVVGKKMTAEQVTATAPAPDILTALDQKNAALETARTPDAASLTFQDELTRKAPSTEIAKPAEKPADKVAEKPTPAPEAPRVADVFPKVEVAAGDKASDKPAEVAAAKPVEKPAEKPAEKVKLPEVKESPKEEPVMARTRDAGSLKEAFGKVQKAAPVDTAANGSWTLQLSAYQDKAEAERFAAGLRDKGYAPFLVESTIAGKGTWFRVRMGRFANKDAASKYMSDFKRETQMNAFVTNAN